MEVCAAKGSRGGPHTFVCFHCPLVAPAGAKSLRNKKVNPASHGSRRNPRHGFGLYRADSSLCRCSAESAAGIVIFRRSHHASKQHCFRLLTAENGAAFCILEMCIRDRSASAYIPITLRSSGKAYRRRSPAQASPSCEKIGRAHV